MDEPQDQTPNDVPAQPPADVVLEVHSVRHATRTEDQPHV